MKYIDADLLKSKLKDVATEFKTGNYYLDNSEQAVGYENALIDFEQLVDSLQQEQPDKESLNESQQEFVDIVTERMLKEGPIPTLKGKQKAEFEKEFNRFKQITGMINFPAHMEVYKRIILWFMAWGADNLPNLGKPIDLGKMDIQQEQPEASVENYIQSYLEAIGFGYGGWVDGLRDEDLKKIARHFYKLGLKARKEE